MNDKLGGMWTKAMKDDFIEFCPSANVRLAGGGNHSEGSQLSCKTRSERDLCRLHLS
jgi:hypothetical protein